MPSGTSSAEVRASLVATLRRDLIGPMPEDADLARELLPLPPSSWYLTGYLVSVFAPSKVKARDAEEEMDDGADGAGADDVAPPERTARRSFLPSSCGLSLLLEPGTHTIEAEVSWGEYRREVNEQGLEDDEAPVTADLQTKPEPRKPAHQRHAWRRQPRSEPLRIELPEAGAPAIRMPVPNADGLEVSALVRNTKVPTESGLRAALAVSVFVVNRRFSLGEGSGEESIAFQVRLELRSPAILPRYDCRGYASDDWDERLADLHYRDVAEHAVGHNASVECVGEEAGGGCACVRTSWLPKAMVERTEPRQIAPEAMFRMATLGALPDADAARTLLTPLIEQYRQWTDGQRPALANLAVRRREVAVELLDRAGLAAKRMEDGIDALSDPDALEAFRIANRAMAESASRRLAREQGVRHTDIDPAWRPFQLAFILLNLRGIVDPTHIDRETVDLLFFPTGGGKTEAYLGLAAFTLVYRRLRHGGDGGRGLCVLMRYTLRLLTLDQLGRAAAMICALELEREKVPETLGSWPFEIALWVGRAATPNRMGRSDINDPNSARRRVIAYKNNSSRNPAPLPIEECPWCGTGFKPESFRLVPDDKAPINLEIRCAERSCAFTRERRLPIVAVDEPIYDRLPAFMIATADKFAALPWTGETARFFGRISRDRELPPPDLIIQDELHLISGPLGTMAGLYERAIDFLARREDVNGRTIRPKIIASTATVRLAQRQIKALFDRDRTEIFPPPGPDRRDSFFARQVPPDEVEPRLYLGLAAQGRGPKVLFLRAATSLMAAAERLWKTSKATADNPADPYMTTVAYFNALRELGSARRIVEDEIRTRLQSYGGTRQRLDPPDRPFADRQIAFEPLELTSRVGTNKVAEAKRRLAAPFAEQKQRVDVALATNMISVGLDITRLGLMLVLGQPKTTAEYIQATSRVGRQNTKPGLVVTLLNVHKPRDRSHFERFEVFHRAFYRNVEATSVTPFSPRALDRGLPAVAVAIARLGLPELTGDLGAGRVTDVPGKDLDALCAMMKDYAAHHSSSVDATLPAQVEAQTRRLYDDWGLLAHDYAQGGTTFGYARAPGVSTTLLKEMLDPELDQMSDRVRRFRAPRSLRDVEESVLLDLLSPEGKPLKDNQP